MIFMVIEHFKYGPVPVGERFQLRGRMLPDGLEFRASWVDSAGMRCFQVMEAGDRQLLDAWIVQWNDLVEFEVIPVLTSAEFWAQSQRR